MKTVTQNAASVSSPSPRRYPPERVLMGPGPSEVPARVREALAAPTLGHLDPEYLRIMDDTRGMLQQVFRTTNHLTLAIPGTGSAGMEACVANLLEPGDQAIICVAGAFGARMADMAERHGATVHQVQAAWGQAVDPAAVEAALRAHPGCKLVGIVHAETSTGMHQPLDEISRLAHDAGALLLVDAVTSLGGHELRVDDWRIDACYSATQKCLSCPPGLAPVTFGPAALEAMDRRKTKVRSWYLDMSLIRNYWSADRVYHHTAPVNMTYALREALLCVLEEGLEARVARHRTNHLALRAGLEGLGLTYIPARSLASLNAVNVPAGVEDAAVRARLLNDFGIEIGGGLGPFKGKAWRIGLMGASSSHRHVTLLLGALREILGR
ncbi:MAG TPA: alanine--glyoxylate aminotransferase family protein [Polyangia bacterium]|nr:alanine--glyoxylate aminotransferase family protein [Polyangia bacterium]